MSWNQQAEFTRAFTMWRKASGHDKSFAEHQLSVEERATIERLIKLPDPVLHGPEPRPTPKPHHTGRHQRGHIFEASGAFYVRYYSLENGERKQRSKRLCEKNREAGTGTQTSKKVRELCEDFMRTVNTEAPAPSAVTVVEFWEQTYLPFITTNLKPSTVAGYTNIWNYHLKTHFGTSLITNYKTATMSILLTNLSKMLRPRTLQHIKFLSSSIFSHAVAVGACDTNPIRDAMVLGKTLPDGVTEAYSLEEIEQVINALVEHTDCQLIMALACFLGLRKGEIQGLQWGDIEEDVLHIRRAVVRGIVGTPKSLKSTRQVPLIAPVKVLLVLWRVRSQGQTWVFQDKNGNPVWLKDFAAKRIRPALQKAGLRWKGFHAGRRGLGTALRSLTGNSNAGRDILGHSTTQVTEQHYEAAMPAEALKGMKLLEERVSKP